MGARRRHRHTLAMAMVSLLHLSALRRFAEKEHVRRVKSRPVGADIAATAAYGEGR